MSERVGHANFRRLAVDRRREASISLLDEDIDAAVEEAEEPVVERPTPTTLLPVRRVTPNDLPEICPWLLERLAQVWPTVGSPMWLSKMRAWMQMNDAAFLRTESAVGLAMAQRDDMDARVRVTERFVLGRHPPIRAEKNVLDPIEAEIVAIYRTMKSWAQSKDAIRFNVLIHSDLLPNALDRFFGASVVKRAEVFMRLVK